MRLTLGNSLLHVSSRAVGVIGGIPVGVTYELRTDPGWTTGRLEIEVAYVSIPDLAVTRHAQRYTRIATGYRYESGHFTADVTVDEDGVVIDYADLWQRV